MFVLSRGAANGDVLKCSALTGLLITFYEPPRDFKASNIGPIGLAGPASPIGPMSGGGGGGGVPISGRPHPTLLPRLAAPIIISRCRPRQFGTTNEDFDGMLLIFNSFGRALRCV